MGKSYSLASITVTTANLNIPIMAATSLRMNGGWVKITNETPYAISASINEDSTTIPPQSIGGLKLDNTTSILYVIANSLIPQSAPSSVIAFEVHPDEDLPDGLPIPLPRQSAPTSPASQAAYTAFFTYSSSNGVNSPAFNIFNPLNSGKIGIFYYCRVSTSGGSGAAATLDYFVGADINLNTAVNIQPADPDSAGGSIQPASVMHATGTVNQNIIQSIVPWESILALAAFQQYDLIPFPDQKAVRPGMNILIFTTGPSGQAGSMSMKWNEQ